MYKNQQNSLDPTLVARRAYELYLARGGEPGHDLEDWLRAEDELRSTVERPAPATTVKASRPTRTTATKRSRGKA